MASKGNGNSKTYSIYIDNTEAERAVEKLRKTAVSLDEEIKKVVANGGDATKQMQKLAATQAQIKSLQDAIDKGLNKSLRDYQNEVKKAKALMDRAADPEVARKLKDQWEAAKRALLEYEANVLNIEQAQNRLKKENQGFGSQLKDFVFGTVIGNGITDLLNNAIGGIKEFFNASIEGALEAETVVAEFERTLSKIGRIEAAPRLEDFAENIKDQISYLDDEDILKVFEQLIDLGQLTEQQIRQLTPVIIDFAAKEGTELPAAAEQIAKALAGQGKALKDYGIHISNAGTVADRFNIIMTELKTKVDGAAEAFGDTNRGQIEKTRQAIDDLQEDIGTKLLPAYTGILSVIGDVIDGTKIWLNDLASIPSLIIQNLRGVNKEIINLNNGLRNNKGFVDSTVQDFAGKGLPEQEKLFQQNLAIAKASQAKVKQLEAENKKFSDEALKAMANGNQEIIVQTGGQNVKKIKELDYLAQQGKLISDEYRKAVVQLDADAKILAQTKSILDANKKNPILGTGDGRDIAAEDAAKKKSQHEREQAEKLAEDLRGISTELSAYNESQYAKDIAAVEKNMQLYY